MCHLQPLQHAGTTNNQYIYTANQLYCANYQTIKTRTLVDDPSTGKSG